MKRWIAPLLRPLRGGGERQGRLIHQPPPEALQPHDERAVAQQLCRTLDRAVELGLWDHAHRVAGTAARIAQRSPQLTDRLASLALSRGEVESALSVIEACPARASKLNLMRVLCMIKTGRISEAHLEVFRWSREVPAVPPPIRLILALLEWHSGDAQAAISALLNEIQESREPDLRVFSLLVAVCIATGRRDLARAWSLRLRSVVAESGACTDDAAVDSTDLRNALQPLHPGWSPDISVPNDQLAESWLMTTVDEVLTGFLPDIMGQFTSSESETGASPEAAILSFGPRSSQQLLQSAVIRRRRAA